MVGWMGWMGWGNVLGWRGLGLVSVRYWWMGGLVGG